MVVLEAAEAVGGRIMTDVVDTMLLDRGFQLLNPAYPAVPTLVDVDALQLQPFDAGVRVAAQTARTCWWTRAGTRSVPRTPCHDPPARWPRSCVSPGTWLVTTATPRRSRARWCAGVEPDTLPPPCSVIARADRWRYGWSPVPASVGRAENLSEALCLDVRVGP